MPKVTQEYFDNKRKMIVDCTYKVCLIKPVEGNEYTYLVLPVRMNG